MVDNHGAPPELTVGPTSGPIRGSRRRGFKSRQPDKSILVTFRRCKPTPAVDSVILAPTRDLIADLNHRARAHRLASAPISGRDVERARRHALSATRIRPRLKFVV